MNIRLTPHGEELLREQLARGDFRSPEEVIEQALRVLAEKRAAGAPAQVSFRRRKPEEFEAFLDRLAAYSDKIPPMPEETFSREMIYQDQE